MSWIRTYLESWKRLIRQDKSHVFSKLVWGLKSYGEWKDTIECGRQSLTDGQPWITFEARSFVESILTPEAEVFEYGAGGSSVFYSQRVKSVISVEHDKAWFNQARDALAERSITNCTLVLSEPEPANESDDTSDTPEAYRSSDEAYMGYSFRNYVRTIDSFSCLFDFVAIDGRARPSCVAHARHKLKPGGYLMLDNSERPNYQKAKALLLDWEKHEFPGPGPYGYAFWETTIWRRSSR